MTFEKLKETYAHLVTEWAARNKYVITDHTTDIIISILLHRDKIINNGGSFVQAFMANNLHDVIRFADNEVMANLRTIFQAYHNIDTYYQAKAFKDALEKENQTQL